MNQPTPGVPPAPAPAPAPAPRSPAPRPPAPAGGVVQAIQQFGCWIALGAALLGLIALIIGAIGWSRPPTGPLEARLEAVEGHVQTLAANDSDLAAGLSDITAAVRHEVQTRQAADSLLGEDLDAEVQARKAVDSRVSAVSRKVDGQAQEIQAVAKAVKEADGLLTSLKGEVQVAKAAAAEAKAQGTVALAESRAATKRVKTLEGAALASAKVLRLEVLTSKHRGGPPKDRAEKDLAAAADSLCSRLSAAFAGLE